MKRGENGRLGGRLRRGVPLVGDWEEANAQSSVVWSVSLQSAHEVTGVSARAMTYAIWRDGSNWSHLAPGPVLLRRYTVS